MVKQTPEEERQVAFEAWMQRVDRHIQSRVSLSADDLPDYCYRDSFDAGLLEIEAAREVLDAAGFLTL